ncbi:MAG: hypothetical protein R2711_04215 [Acidimicrobiales bacterium]
MGKKILDRVAEEVAHTGRVEVYPKLDGPRNMIMVLAPDKKAQAEAKKRSQAEPAPDGAAPTEPTAPEPAAEAADTDA